MTALINISGILAILQAHYRLKLKDLYLLEVKLKIFSDMQQLL